MVSIDKDGNYSPFQSKALALKLILRQNVSERIIAAIDASVFLESSIAFAKKLDTTKENKAELVKIKWQIESCKNPELKKIYEKRYVELAKTPVKSEQTQIWDKEAYQVFYEIFRGLFRETCDNIWNVDYPRENIINNGEVVNYGTEESIKLLFKFGLSGEHNPRVCLDLFEEYMTALYNSKMTNFRTVSYAGELERSF